jgi:hypothetical protein
MKIAKNTALSEYYGTWQPSENSQFLNCRNGLLIALLLTPLLFTPLLLTPLLFTPLWALVLPPSDILECSFATS